MNNLTETNQASMPLGIFASKSVFRKTNLGGVGTPPYVAGVGNIVAKSDNVVFFVYPLSFSAWLLAINESSCFAPQKHSALCQQSAP